MVHISELRFLTMRSISSMFPQDQWDPHILESHYKHTNLHDLPAKHWPQDAVKPFPHSISGLEASSFLMSACCCSTTWLPKPMRFSMFNERPETPHIPMENTTFNVQDRPSRACCALVSCFSWFSTECLVFSVS